MRVLIHEHFTGGGMAGHPLPTELADAGMGMHQALVEDFLAAGCEVVTTRDERVPFKPTAAKVVVLQPDDVAAQVRPLAESAHVVLVVAPETGNVLFHWAQRLHNWDIPSLGSSPDAVALCADKFKTATHLKNHGVPSPPVSKGSMPRLLAGIERSLQEGENAFVLKPRDGAGCEHTFVLRKRSDVRRIRHEFTDSNPIAQAFVAGRSVSVSFIVTPKQIFPLLAGDQTIEGETCLRYAGGVIPSTLPQTEVAVATAHSAIASIEGLHGFVGVDLVIDENTGVPWVIDINPRLTVSYCALRKVSKVNLAEAMLQRTVPDQWIDETIRFNAHGEIEEPTP